MFGNKRSREENTANCSKKPNQQDLQPPPLIRQQCFLQYAKQEKIKN